MPLPHRSFVLFTAGLAIAGCARSDRNTADSAGGNVVAQMARTADTGNPSSVTPAAGEVKVTATDARSVRKAEEYRLTEENFRHFIQASDSVDALRRRDPQVRAFLDKNITDGGNGTRVATNDAGLKHLEADSSVSRAINSAGISVPDYFVAGIAIAQAERFMGNPKAAPPTPALSANAAFLRAHSAELTALRTRQAKPAP
ncbi:MAG: hypothetical protein ACJ8AD_07235 [Gemmatimonadaceae bacterium]